MHIIGKQIAWISRRGCLIALIVGAGVLLATAVLRGAEYDENYTLLLAAGTPRPAWPAGVFTAGAARTVFSGHASFARIADDLRVTDVHPPLYFWLVAIWRWLVGPSLFGVRLLSVLCSVAALAMVGAIARVARVPPASAILLTIGCYGFAYTGAIARDVALGQALSLAGVWLALRAYAVATTPRSLRHGWPCAGHPRTTVAARMAGTGPAITGRAGLYLAVAAGLSLGAATLSNYLTGFVAGAVLLWLLGKPRLWLAAIVGFATWLPADLWFYLAQRNSRPGQYPPFSLTGSLPRLAQYSAANLFGGLPLYVDAPLRAAVAATLAAFAVALIGLIAVRWHRIGTRPARWMLLLAALAPPSGLLLLGVILGQTPIELRYLAFATPFFGLLLAGALASLRPRQQMCLGAVIAALQIAALIGMMTRQETMQPARATAAAAASLAHDGVVLLPRGNDGVGVVGAFVNEAPDSLRIAIVDVTDTGTVLRARADDAKRVVLALIGVDATSRATVAAMRAAFIDRPCWHLAGAGFNVIAYDCVCEGDDDVLRRLHADQDRSPGR